MLELQDIFAATVARGWRPRNPAFEPELADLTASYCSGKCLEPLIIEGDIAYIDPRVPARSGDLVVFALSHRGAAAQNENLHAGQSPWRAGDRWMKLLERWCGYDMLLERRHSATATLLACESPDDVPVLWPVRQIERNGRLLFATSNSTDIALTAATSTAVATLASSFTVSVFPSGLTSAYNVLSVSIGPFNVATTVIVTASGTWNNPSTTRQALLAYGLGTTSTGVQIGQASNTYSLSGGVNDNGTLALEGTYSLPANTSQTFYLNAQQLPSNGVGTGLTITAGCILKAEAIKR